MISAEDAFEPLRTALEAAGVRYAVGGSWASTAFGEPRFTNDVDILVDFNLATLNRFLSALPQSFFADADEACEATRQGRAFNVIYMPAAFKFDFFPARAFPLGLEELDRAVWLERSGLSREAVPFVTPEDILLAKLHWFDAGGQVSEVQWRDILGIVRNGARSFDHEYLHRSADRIQVAVLLEKALREK